MENYKKNFRKILIFTLFISSFLVPSFVCQAASATLNLSSGSESAVVGEDITVSLSVSSDAMLGDFEAYVTYNADILEFKSDASFIAGGEGLLKLTDKNSVNQEKSRKYIMKFTAKAIGVSEITIKDKAEIYDFESGLAMSVSSNRLDIKVLAAKTASDNTNLKSLKINPGVLSPAFDKAKTEYKTDLEYKTEKLILSAVPEDDNANVTIEGNDKLIVGINKIILKVKAESGASKEYIILATRNEEDKSETGEINESNETDTNNETNTQEYNNIGDKTAEIGKVVIRKDGGNIYIQNGFRYQIVVPGNEVTIPEGYIKTSLILNEVPVTTYTLEEDLENDFLLIYAKNEEGEAGFYQYDRKEATLQRYIKVREGNKVVKSPELIQSEKYKEKLTTMGVVLAILGAICIIMSVALIRVYQKNKD